MTHYFVSAILPLQVCGEQHRFEKLMEYFRNEDSNIDFMVSSEPALGAEGWLGPVACLGAAKDLGGLQQSDH